MAPLHNKVPTSILFPSDPLSPSRELCASQVSWSWYSLISFLTASTDLQQTPLLPCVIGQAFSFKARLLCNFPAHSTPTLRLCRALVCSLNLLRTTRNSFPGQAPLIYSWSEQNTLCSLLSGARNGLKLRNKIEFYAFPHDYFFSNTNDILGGYFPSSPPTIPFTQFLLIPTPSHFFPWNVYYWKDFICRSRSPRVLDHPLKHSSF